MGKKKGYFGIMTFIYFALMTIVISFVGNFNFTARILLFIISFITLLTGLLIPSIYCIRERKFKNSIKYLYSIIPISLFWFLIYTLIIALVFSDDFLSGFTTFLGLGLFLSILGGLIVPGLAALDFYP